MQKLNKPQKVLFTLSIAIFGAFIFAVIGFIVKGKEEIPEQNNVLGAITDKKTRLNYYINNNFSNPLIEEVTQGNIISAKEEQVKAEITDKSSLYCLKCSFIYSDEFGLSILSGLGYLENMDDTSISVVFEREVFSLTPNSKVIFDYTNKTVHVVYGAITNRGGEVIETNQQYKLLVDNYYLRASDLADNVTLEVRSLGYFLDDLNVLPSELSFLGAEI